MSRRPPAPQPEQYGLAPREIVVDLFAGGGGASTGIRAALGRCPDIAINHSAAAIAMHEANHPTTTHYQCDIWEVDPRVAVGRRKVGLLWASPDCTHFSRAKSGVPKSKRIRSLATVVIRWAAAVRPRVIMLENVEEFAEWCPLVPQRDERGGLRRDADGAVLMRPCPRRKGATFRRWVRELRALGYAVEWRELRACDYGSPTIRKRLYVIARCDGQPIVWPAPTHGRGRRHAQRTAAGCIDWSIPCPSIFLTREQARALGLKIQRPLKPATMRRIARGVKKYVLDAAQPFVVVCNHGGDWFRGQSFADPLSTVTASRDARGVVVPFLVPRYGEREGQQPRCGSVEQPAPTIVPKGNGASLCAAFMAQHNGGMVGHAADRPLSTITQRGTQQQVVAAYLSHQRGDPGRGCGGTPSEPVPTITAGGNHAALVYAFLASYYGAGIGQPATDPLRTIPTHERFAVVRVDGVEHVIVDIGMRMLTPRELFRCQGFGDAYLIDRGPAGRRLTKSEQTRLVGNSVCPQVAEALVRANVHVAQTGRHGRRHGRRKAVARG